MPRGEPAAGSPRRLFALIATAAILAVTAVLVLRADDAWGGPTLTTADIAGLPDAELMRRVRVDLTARLVAGATQPPPVADLLPVQRSIAFEEARLGIGLAGALAASGGAHVLAGDFAALGADQVANCLQRLAVLGADADRSLQFALQQAGMQQRRAAWVRAHAAAFATDRR